MPEMPFVDFGEESATRSVAPRSIVPRRQAGNNSSRGGRDHLNMATENADESAPRQGQEAPGQADIFVIEHPEQQADPPSRTVQISLDAMILFLTAYAMQLRELRRRRGITSITIIACCDGTPDVVMCSIIITGESDDSVRGVAEDIEDSGWTGYQAGRDYFEQDYMRTA